METLIVPSRRSFLRGLGAILAAPAIVTASNLMPIRGLVMPPENWMGFGIESADGVYDFDYAELAAVNRKAFVPRLTVQLYSESPLLKYALSE